MENINPIKQCPLCEHENPATASFCEKCDADLMNVSPIIPRLEGRKEKDPDKSTFMPSADVKTQREQEEETATRRIAAQTLTLELVENPAVQFTIRSNQTVGRSARADVVLANIPDLEYISRAHARFMLRRTQWYVQYIAEGNSITVDGVESTDDAEMALYDQSILKLSFTPFRVKLN